MNNFDAQEELKPSLVLTLVVDESGSMAKCKEETIIGINTYVNTLKSTRQDTEIVVTLIMFSSTNKIVYTNVSIDDVAELTEETYKPNGYTALYDAIEHGIELADEYIATAPLGTSSIVAIITDGKDNMSRNTTSQNIKQEIVTRQENQIPWTFVFIGADQDAWTASQSLGIDPGTTTGYEKADTAVMFCNMATGTTRYLDEQRETYAANSMEMVSNRFSKRAFFNASELDQMNKAK